MCSNVCAVCTVTEYGRHVSQSDVEGDGCADNDLGDGGGTQIASALRFNTTLTSLHLECE